MKITVPAVAAAAAIALASVALPTTADARCRGCGVAAGVLGGIAAGAIIGGAIAGSPPPAAYYGPAPAYGPPPAYYDEGPRCYWTRGEPVWDGYRWVRPKVQVCD